MGINLAQRERAAGDANLHADTHLRGRWLLAARVIWVALAVAIAGLNLMALPEVAPSLLTTDVLQELRRLDFSPSLYTALNIAIIGVCLLLYLATAALLFWRRSEDRMAFLGALMLLTFGGAVLGFLPLLPPLVLPWNLLVSGLFFLGQVSFGAFFYLFPSGRFVPRQMRWLALLNAIFSLVLLILPEVAFSAPFIPLFLLTAMVAQIYRYRSISTSMERQQTKWVVIGFVLATMIFILTRLMGLLIPPDLKNSDVVGGTLVAGGSVYFALMLLPIFICIAILRSHLFDIDLIIKRTLVYSTLTACVVGIYILVVGYLGAVFRTSGNLLISLCAASVVAVAFQPLRERLQRGVNRLLYGLRDEPYVVLSRLGQRLETTLTAATVLSTIVETVREALKLSYAAIEVKEGLAFVLAAAAGVPSASKALRLPLMYQNEAVGTLIIAPRGRDETLTPADVHLLHDLVGQIGIAVHTVRLTTDLQVLTRDLQSSRENLVTAREEERRRLRRDLHDGLGPMLSAVMLKVGLLRTLYQRDVGTADALLNQLEEEIDLIISDVRRVVYDLRPPALDELGLVGAIREYVARLNIEGQADRTALAVTVEVPESLPPLPAAIEVAAYRIVQEAVTNVIRHAQAQTCRVRVWANTGLHIEVSDDGIGVDETDRAGVGLTSMHERAEELRGTLTIRKTKPCGTQVTAWLPLPDSTLVSMPVREEKAWNR